MLLWIIPRPLRRRFAGQRSLLWLLQLMVLLVVACTAFTVLFKLVEDVSWQEAVWQVWQTATTVGYGNRPAETTLGRAVTIVFGLVVIGILGTALGGVFDHYGQRRTQRRLGLMSNPHTDGYVIFNFPGADRLATFIREIRHVEPEVGICVVDGRIEQLPESINALPNVAFVRGSILNRDTYERAAVRSNKVVVVFPIEAGVSDSDGSTNTVVDLVSQSVDPDRTRIIHVLVDPNNEWIFGDVASTRIFEGLEVLALIQECQDPSSAATIQQLLRNTAGANPDTFPAGAVAGTTWGELQEHSARACQVLGVQANVLALVRGGRPDACPSSDMVIDAGDTISIIRPPDFDWEGFQAELVRQRTASDARQPRSPATS